MLLEEELLQKFLQERKIADHQTKVTKLLAYLQLVLKKNEVINLTAISNYQEAIIKHLYDSLLIIDQPQFQKASRIIDIGSGAGIPTFPLAICFPEKEFVTLDATQKKINFQQAVSEQLALTNVTPIWGRAEELAHQREYRAQFELVIARAVAAMNVLLELTIPFVQISGFSMFYKGKGYQEEITASQKALKLLNCVYQNVSLTQLPNEQGERSLILVQKTQATSPQYPRKPGIPNKKPL